jgi:putative transposase
LSAGRPEIFNSDQGCQFILYLIKAGLLPVRFTSAPFTGVLAAHGVRISMDGRGRVFDNIFVERLWRTVKYEDIYLRDYSSVAELDAGLAWYFRFYNEERPHQSLGYRTPGAVHRVVKF